jgi:hypothetical protein
VKHQKSTTDSVIEEIHRMRREISARFNGDIAAIADDAARRQATSGRPMWQPQHDEDRVADPVAHPRSHSI